MENQATYRVRTKLGETNPIVIPVSLMQEYNTFEILSLKVNTDDTYRSYTSPTGMVIGRVSTANNGLGVPNVRVSIFVPKGTYDQSDEEEVLYPFSSPTDTDNDRVRYNLLPSDSDVSCYQVVGTMPTKRKILDNETICEVFDKYYKYTTVTNEAGDFMLSEIPVGKQRIHIDADLSDIGPFLSQRPYDMIENLGYNENEFESTRQFKTSADLDSLVQILCQNKSVYVYPYWGDSTENNSEMKITRTDLTLNYEFKTSAVFIGSVITDKRSNSIRHNCTATENEGKMSDMVTGPGRIEMIRKTVDNKIEQYRVKGDDLIDENGVWCYQVPMNLDYVRTDEFGNIIPTDDPDKGIPTRARVRFRVTLNEMEDDVDNHKRCSYLVPNNPKASDGKFLVENDADYSFGSDTWDESFVDMFWNKVYTVKNYVPRIQKTTKATNRKHTGVKMVNNFGDNNPFPYNGMTIKLPFQFRLICVLVKIFIDLIWFLNVMIATIGGLPCWILNTLGKALKKIPLVGGLIYSVIKTVDSFIPSCISLSSEFCDDGINKNVTYPGCDATFDCVWEEKTKPDCVKEQNEAAKETGESAVCTTSTGELITCVENQLAQANEATSFNFGNDWINGCLVMPLWKRRIKPKKSYFFGLFKRKAKDEWCAGEKNINGKELKLITFCSPKMDTSKSIESSDYHGDKVEYYTYPNIDDSECNGDEDCHEAKASVPLTNGVIMNRENMYGQTVWYYKAVEVDSSLNGMANEYLDSKSNPRVCKTLYATDIVMLGSLSDCDLNGIPKFFNYLSGTTYNMPTDILFTDTEIEYVFDEDGNLLDQENHKTSVSAGCDWGNKNEYGYGDGGLFYGIGCSSIDVRAKSCINLRRICEIGVGEDEMKYVENLEEVKNDTDELNYNETDYNLRPDGYVSYDDIIDFDYRSMFATMNGNGLKTKINTTNGVREYDFRHLYIDNFDGALYYSMEDVLKKRTKANYRYNANLETYSYDYLTFRMGDNPYYYDGESIVSDSKKNTGPRNFRLPKYKNSFYFYFGLKEGKTAIDIFNEKYNGACSTDDELEENIQYEKSANSWCCLDSDDNNTYDHSTYDGYLKINLEDVALPCSAILNSNSNTSITYTVVNSDGETSINDENICFHGSGSDEEASDCARYYLVYENGGEVLSSECCMLNNGEYTMYLTDGDGNKHTYAISISRDYLSCSYAVDEFAQPNNVLLEYYGTYVDVAKAPSTGGISVSVDGDGEISATRTDGEIKLNGTILLYNIFDSDGSDLAKFKVEVKPYGTDDDLEEYEVSCICANDGSSIEIDETDYFYASAFELNNVRIPCLLVKCPKGDVNYRVRVTQLCDNGEESQNYIEYKIYVGEPTPYKLYINGIDYDIIKNFKTGWSLSTSATQSSTDPFNGNGNVNGIEGWTEISNSSNGVYNWSADSEKYGSDSGRLTEEQEENRASFIESMKSAFWIQSEDEPFTITYEVLTGDAPYEIWSMYNAEFESAYDGDYNETESEGGKWTYTNDQNTTINDIKIPNITYKSSKDFGTSPDGASYDVCYAQDNIAQYGGSDSSVSTKPPYVIACVNKAGVTKPSGLSFAVSGNTTDGYGFNGQNISKGGIGFFQFVLIDKIFKCDVIYWSYINNIPYYNAYNGDGFVNAYGLVAGLVYNGISSSVNAYGYVDDFTETTAFDKEVFIETFSNDSEDSIPTRRCILSDSDSDTYPGYKHTNGIINSGNYLQYANVYNKQGELNFTDANNNAVVKSIYGSMRIQLSSESLNDCENYSFSSRNQQLIVSLSNSNSEASYTFYIFNASNTSYPINSFSNNVIECNGVTGSWSTDSDLFNKNVSESMIKAAADKSVSSQTTTEDGDGNETDEDTAGYGNTGMFTVYNRPYFIIAVGDDGGRTISPVYDYSMEIAFSMLLEIGNGDVYGADGDGDGDATGDSSDGSDENTIQPIDHKTYTITITLTAKNSYYLDYYPYTVEIDISGQVIKNETEDGSQSNGATVKFNLDDDDNLLDDISTETWTDGTRELKDDRIKEKVTVYVTDVTGLRHKCVYQGNNA